MSENEIYETVKEYSLSHSGFDFKIRARISKRSNPTGHFDYDWDICHFCRPSEEAISVYIPGKMMGNNFEETKIHLFMYLNQFTSIGVVKNKYY